MIAGASHEQLFLLGLANVLQHTARDGRLVHLLQYPPKDHWHTLGVMTLQDLSQRPPPQVVDGTLLKQLLELWDVVISNTPGPLFAVRDRGIDIDALPCINRAFDELISAYPREDSGLTLAQERLLAATPRDWTESPHVIGRAMVGDQPGGRLFADNILFADLIGMGDTTQAHPLVDLRGDRRDMQSCEVRLTEFGQACLAGQINHVRVNGIDTWVGGVHLSSAHGRVWFRNVDGGLVDTEGT